MFKRKLPLILSLASLAILSGCQHSTSNRVAYSTQPAVVAPVPVQQPCGTPGVPCPNAGAVPPPPTGFIR